jgi:pimeloyl-ACP methyl ester carboxylesterase
MLTEKRFDAGEISINHAEGPASGPPLLLLHGGTLRWQTFEYLIPRLIQSHHVFACDFRGHGKSGWATTGYRVVDYVGDTTAFVAHHFDQPTILLGYSLGAFVTMGVAAQSPHLAKAAILLDPPLLLRDIRLESTSAYAWFSWVRATLQTARSAEEVTARWKRFMQETGQAFDEAAAQSAGEMVYSLDPKAIAAILNDELLTGFDMDQMLPRIACPTLLLYGELDRGSYVRDEDADWMKAKVAQCSAFQIKDVGHELPWGQPAKVLEHITRFLSALYDHEHP